MGWLYVEYGERAGMKSGVKALLKVKLWTHHGKLKEFLKLSRSSSRLALTIWKLINRLNRIGWIKIHSRIHWTSKWNWPTNFHVFWPRKNPMITFKSLFRALWLHPATPQYIFLVPSRHSKLNRVNRCIIHDFKNCKDLYPINDIVG